MDNTNFNDLMPHLKWIDSTDLIIFIHQKDRIVWMSDATARLFKGPKIGDSFYKFLSPEFHALGTAMVERIYLTGYAPTAEIKCRDPEGNLVFLNCSSQRVLWKEAPAILLCAENTTILHDLSEFTYSLLKILLSPRELDFLHCRSQGISHGEISKRWNVSYTTVKNYPGEIKKKLKVDEQKYLEILQYLFIRGFFMDSLSN